MFKKLSDGFGFGLGFSLAALIVSGITWFGYNYIQTPTSPHAMPSDTKPAVLTKSELQQKECSLLILLYGETQDTEIADPIKKLCR